MTKSRATLVAIADNPSSRIAAEAWLQENQHLLSFVSENLGCGCCVDIWNIEGDSDIISSIPSELLSSSEWINGNES
jgi:hypothetical protein